MYSQLCQRAGTSVNPKQTTSKAATSKAKARRHEGATSSSAPLELFPIECAVSIPVHGSETTEGVAAVGEVAEYEAEGIVEHLILGALLFGRDLSVERAMYGCVYI